MRHVSLHDTISFRSQFVDSFVFRSIGSMTLRSFVSCTRTVAKLEYVVQKGHPAKIAFLNIKLYKSNMTSKQEVI